MLKEFDQLLDDEFNSSFSLCRPPGELFDEKSEAERAFGVDGTRRRVERRYTFTLAGFSIQVLQRPVASSVRCSLRKPQWRSPEDAIRCRRRRCDAAGSS